MATAVTSDSSTHSMNVIKLHMPHNFLSFMYRVGETSPWPCAEAHRFRQFQKSFVPPKLAAPHFSSGFCCKEIRNVLCYYATNSGNLLPKFWDNLSVPSSRDWKGLETD